METRSGEKHNPRASEFKVISKCRIGVIEMNKLRNKYTGEIREFVYIKKEYGTNFMLAVKNGENTNELFAYDSLAQLNDEWEDAINWEEIQERIFRPKEPLIKDEKIRKAVRAWAEVNGVDKVEFCVDIHKNWWLSYSTNGDCPS